MAGASRISYYFTSSQISQCMAPVCRRARGPIPGDVEIDAVHTLQVVCLTSHIPCTGNRRDLAEATKLLDRRMANPREADEAQGAEAVRS